MGKLYDLIKQELEDFKKYKSFEKIKYIEYKSFPKLYKAHKDASRVNSLMSIINKDPAKYFGSKDAFNDFLKKNDDLFLKDNTRELPTISKKPNHDYEEIINYEELLNNMEEKIGQKAAQELVKDFEDNKNKVIDLYNKPLIPLANSLKNEVDALGFNENEKKEIKENLDYIGDNFVEKKQESYMDNLIDHVSTGRIYGARYELREYALENGIDPERLEAFNASEKNRLEILSTTKEDVEFTKQIGLKKMTLNEDYKQKILRLNAKVEELGVPSFVYAGESGEKYYGLYDYYAKGKEITYLMGTYKNLKTPEEKMNALNEINLKTKEMKQIEDKYEQIFSFIKDNFDLNKISLSGNIYAGRVMAFHPEHPEAFIPNMPAKWDDEKAAIVGVLSGFCQLKGAAQEAEVSVEDYLNDPIKCYLKQALKLFEQEDEKFYPHRSPELSLGKRMARSLVMAENSHQLARANIYLKGRGVEFIQNTTPLAEDTVENAIIANVGTNYMTLYEHTPDKIFMVDKDTPDYESLRNLFAMGDLTDKLYQLSENYYDANMNRGPVINYDYTVKNVNSAHSPRMEVNRVLNAMKDLIVEEDEIYENQWGHLNGEMPNDPVPVSSIFIGAKMCINDYLEKNNINVMALPKADRKFILKFMNDPAKTFVNTFKREIGFNNQTAREFKQQFKEEYNRLNNAKARSSVNSFDNHNRKNNGFNVGKNIQRILSDNKGGILERIGFRTSKEYNALVAAVKAATDPNSPTYGDFTNAKMCAERYLAHKLPQGMDIANVGQTGQKRIEFCNSIIQTYNDINGIENPENNNQIVNNNIIDEEFQNQLENDVNNLNKENVNENIISTSSNVIEDKNSREP